MLFQQETLDLLRACLFESVGFHAHDMSHRIPIDVELTETEWCEEFEQVCRNRMVMGALRYGRLCELKKWKYNLIAGLQRKLDYYQKTGNTEALADIANYASLEFMRPSHPNAHFRGEDAHKHCPTTNT